MRSLPQYLRSVAIRPLCERYYWCWTKEDIFGELSETLATVHLRTAAAPPSLSSAATDIHTSCKASELAC